MDPIAFATVTALQPIGTGRFAADVSPEWTIAGKPNGGYLLALLGRAAVEVGEHPHPVAASAHYIRPPEPGPVEIDVAILRSGRSAGQSRVWMSQGGRLCVEALITCGTLADSTPFWDGGVPRVEVAAFDECVRLPSVSPTGLHVAIMDQVDLRIDQATLGFATGHPGGAGELRGWLGLSGGADFDPLSLLYAVDAFPPATFEVEPTGWVPTFELSVYVRALPAPGPVRVLQKAQLIDAQKVDEVCLVWDSTGRLVAQGTQLAGIRLG